MREIKENKSRVFGPRKETTIYHLKKVVGKLDNESVTLELTIKEIDLSTQNIFQYVNNKPTLIQTGSTKQTINHKEISKYKTLSISGYSYYCAGQLQNELKQSGFVSSIPQKELNKIIEIWDRWHLNDLNPNCEHQITFNCNDHYEEQSKRETAKCPFKYSYGSAWLVEILPEEVIKEIVYLFK
jgi:hypothetical protein